MKPHQLDQTKIYNTRNLLREGKCNRRYENKTKKRHLKESKDEGTQSAQAYDCPTRLDDLLVADSTAKIPYQVTNAVHAVVNEGEGHNGLQADLGKERKSTKGGRHRSRIEVPAQHRRGQVRCGVQVHGTGQHNTGDTVSATANPGDLGTVDRKVGGDRTVPTLLGEDLGWIRGVGGRSRSPFTQSVLLSPKRK